MATKAALQSLQSRLAERLQIPQVPSQVGQWLGVRVRGRHFLLPLLQAGEIYPWADPHPVSYTQDWFLGVVNLRGSLCGVVCLFEYLRLQDVQVGYVPTQHHDRRLVALHPAFELNAVLAVDQLLGLKNAEQMTANPDTTDYTDSAGTVWQPVDLALMVQLDTFLSIAAP